MPLFRVLRASSCALVRGLFVGGEGSDIDGKEKGSGAGGKEEGSGSVEAPPLALQRAVCMWAGRLSADASGSGVGSGSGSGSSSSGSSGLSATPLTGGLSSHPHGPGPGVLHIVCVPANLDVRPSHHACRLSSPPT